MRHQTFYPSRFPPARLPLLGWSIPARLLRERERERGVSLGFPAFPPFHGGWKSGGCFPSGQRRRGWTQRAPCLIPILLLGVNTGLKSSPRIQTLLSRDPHHSSCLWKGERGMCRHNHSRTGGHRDGAGTSGALLIPGVGRRSSTESQGHAAREPPHPARSWANLGCFKKKKKWGKGHPWEAPARCRCHKPSR